jgi:RNA polymerase sigma-70 factor (ECF subfamily)
LEVFMTAFMTELDAGSGDSGCERLWQHRPAMLRLARRRCRTLQDAEDVVGQAFLAALRSAVPDADLGPWLGRVVINLCAQSQRGHYRDLRLLDRAARHAELVDDGMEERVVDRLSAAHITQVAHRLPERQRMVLKLRSDGLSLTEIGTQLGIPPKAVESLLSRARARLRVAARNLLGVLAPLALLRRNWTRGSVAVLAPAAMVGLALGVSTWGAVGSGGASVPLLAEAKVSAPSSGHHAAATQMIAPARGQLPQPPAAARRAAPRTQAIGPQLRPHAGPASAQLGGAERQHPDENLVQSVERCLREHPEVTLAHVGCRQA